MQAPTKESLSDNKGIKDPLEKNLTSTMTPHHNFALRFNETLPIKAAIASAIKMTTKGVATEGGGRVY